MADFNMTWNIIISTGLQKLISVMKRQDKAMKNCRLQRLCIHLRSEENMVLCYEENKACWKIFVLPILILMSLFSGGLHVETSD